MDQTRQLWKVRHKNRLLLSMMKELAGNAHISFEGEFDVAGLAAIPGASQIETQMLKRNTLSPRQEFVVVTLEPSNIAPIISKLGGTTPRGVLHVQIEKDGRL